MIKTSYSIDSFMKYVLLALLLANINLAYASKRVALLIANENYTKSENELQNPVNDARLLSKKLENLGFDVNVISNSDRIAMHEAIDEFGTKSKNAESAVFYYSGHGMQNKYNQNFMIPIGANITNDNSISYTSVNVKKVIDTLNEANPSVSLVMLDACRNNKFRRTRGSRDFGVIAYEADGEMLVSYATQAGQVAEDGIGRNSPYAIAVSQQLDQADTVPLLKLFDNVRKQVRKQTNNDQSPTTKGDTGYETLLLGGQAVTTNIIVSKPDLRILLKNDKSSIDQNYYPEVDALAKKIKNDPNVYVLIEGHTSNDGATRYNQQLSVRMVNSVKARLTGYHRIEPQRIVSVGYGGARPLTSNESEYGKTINRRIDIYLKSQK